MSKLFRSIKGIILLVSLFVFNSVQGQAPQQLNYQAIARKSDGSPIAFQDISVRITIIDSAVSGFPADRIAYMETRKIRTNFAGLFNIIIGGPDALTVSGSVKNVNWITGKKFIRTEIDPSGANNFLQLGMTELQSVPYALFALNSVNSSSGSNLSGAASGDLTGNYPGPSIANKAITAEKIADSSITLQKLNQPLQSTLSNAISINDTSNMLKGYLRSGNLSLQAVSSVSITTLNGITGNITSPTTNPSITLGLGNITPNSIVASSAITATTLGGVITTPSQPLITTLGQLSNLSVSGTVQASGLFGTLITAAQPNITGIGQLTNLSVSGIIQSGIFSGALSGGTQTGITALGQLSSLSVSGTVQAANLNGVLTTVAQPNITSVGQLTNLSVSGTIQANTLSATTVKLTGLAGLTNLSVTGTVEAANLSGTLSTVAQPNITSLGQLSNLSVSGTVQATNLNGILTTASQPNITGIGQLNNLSVSGTIQSNTVSATTVKLTNITGLTNLSVTGTIEAATLSGTISSATQPNITRVGQLSNLSVSGTIEGGSFSGTSVTTGSSQATRYFATMNTVVAASSLTIDLSQGNVISIPLLTSSTISFSNPGTNPASYVIKVSYTSATAFTITWPASVKWSSATAPTLTCASGKTDIISFIYDGTNYFGTYALNF